mmetsp:Transcript_4665/g.13051  ORF Transcript_4665/g.13051 Transcript_4665/m.13051 type:complete len:333 (+) Transcript_4665:1-999(+)
MGIQQLLFVVTKMDEVGYREEAYEAAATAARRTALAAGWPRGLVQRMLIIPTAAYLGENLVVPSKKMPWWKGSELLSRGNSERTVRVRTVLDALTHALTVPERLRAAPLRLPVAELGYIPGAGHVFYGRVEQGCIRKGQRVKFAELSRPNMPDGREVRSLEMYGQALAEAGPGDSVGVTFIYRKDRRYPSRGDVIVEEGEETGAESVVRLTAMIQTLPDSIRHYVTPGHKMLGIVRTASSPMRLARVIRKKNESTGFKWEDNPMEARKLTSKTFAEVELEPEEPLFCEPYDTTPAFGRLALLDEHHVVAVGRITSVEYGVVKLIRTSPHYSS